jgi:hypothetical protein
MIEKLMNLQERWEANQARKAFDEAVAAAKAEIPPIPQRDRPQRKKYADFAAIAKVVDPIIGAHGLSYRFRTTQTDKHQRHLHPITQGRPQRGNHALRAGRYHGNKNAIQAIGSTLTYLQRYSLVQMLGLAARRMMTARLRQRATPSPRSRPTTCAT